MKRPAQRWVWRARLDHVVDGDTLALYIDRGMKQYQTTSIRLLECWAPERNEPGGKEATLFVGQWCAQNAIKNASVAPEGWPIILQTYADNANDKYDRWLGRVWSVGTGRELNADIVAAGHATKKKEGDK